MKWVFTPDEFMHIWAETDLDRYPFPLSMISSVTTKLEYDALTSDLKRRLPRGQDADLSAALRIAARPETAVAVYGSKSIPPQAIRGLGCIVGHSGVVIDQMHGKTADYGGDITVAVCPAAAVPKRVAAMLSEQPPGRIPALVESVERVRDTRVPARVPTTTVTVASRMRRLLKAPRVGAGHLALTRDMHQPVAPQARYISWIDVAGDGRYLVRHMHNDIRIEPCVNGALVHEIAQLVRVR